MRSKRWHAVQRSCYYTASVITLVLLATPANHICLILRHMLAKNRAISIHITLNHVTALNT